MSAQPVDPKPKTRKRRRWLFVTTCLLATLGFTGWYVNSVAFENRVRERVIAELEQATGGKVDLPSFEWHIWKLEFEATDLTIHGAEPAGEIPYAHVDRLKVRLKILSFFRREI